MLSRERLLNAIRRLPVDHVPLWIRFWPGGRGVDNVPFPWRDQVLRAQHLVGMGLDDTLLLEPPLGYVENYDAEQVPGVTASVRLAPDPDGGSHPLLHKEYGTPAGPLRHSVRMTDDWPHGEQIPLFSDFNVSRQTGPVIRNREDLQSLKYLLGEPSPAQVTQFRERARRLRVEAGRLGVALEGGWTALGDAAVWLCGTDGVLYGQADEPEFIDDVLQTVFEWEMRRLDYLLEEGVDFITHMAWYEGTDFWTPRAYRTMLKPRLARMAAKVRARGLPFRYIITRGWRPLREDLVEIGVDCLAGIDPVQDRIDLVEVKRELGPRMCLMGGVNSAVMFTQWSDEQIRNAVADAIRVLSTDGGFILFPVDNVLDEFPWEKVEVLIDAWRERSTGQSSIAPGRCGPG